MRKLNLTGKVVLGLATCLLIFMTYQVLAPILNASTGNPMYIGWWTGVGTSNMSRIDTQHASGENLMVAYYDASSTDVNNYLSKLHQNSVKAYLQIDPQVAFNADTTALTTYVNAYKGNAAVAGWLLYDEPEFSNPRITSASLVTDYNAIKAADPSHPVAIVFGNGTCSYVASTSDANYFNAADVFMLDQYPVRDQAEFQDAGKYKFTDPLTAVTDCLSYLARIGGNKKYMAVEQGFNWGGSGDRDPTYGEERYFTYMPLIHPVAGVTYWVDYRASATLTANVNRVMKEATSLETVFRTGAFNSSDVTVNNGAITYEYGTEAGNTYLIAVNNTVSSVSAQFKLPASATFSTAILVYDAFNVSSQQYQARTLTLTTDGGRKVISDTFSSYQVHIYQLSNDGPPAPPAPPTTPAPVVSKPAAPSAPASSGTTTSTSSAATTTTAKVCVGDYNGDKTIDLTDFGVFASNYKKKGIDCSLDIVGGDCYLDIKDFQAFARNYQSKTYCAQ